MRKPSVAILRLGVMRVLQPWENQGSRYHDWINYCVLICFGISIKFIQIVG